MNKISICTVCMNRLAHLRETLPMNIAQNKDHKNVEFVVLDYNSGDGMEDWVKSNMQEHIQSGVLKYFKNYEPKYFNLSHSKNMAMRLGSGNILCLVDADNFAGHNYAGWISSVYEAQGSNTIITTLRRDKILYRDQGGKLCFNRDLFYEVKGFDESLTGYGIDDVDLVRRVEKAGGNRYFIEDEKFLQFIGHSTEERLRNYPIYHKLDKMYLLVTENMQQQNVILFLFKDKTFYEVTFDFNEHLKNNLVESYQGWTIGEHGLRSGVFSYTDNKLILTFEGHEVRELDNRDPLTLFSHQGGAPAAWTKILRNDGYYLEFIMAYGECMNRKKYKKNEAGEKNVNDNGWGKGTVYLNFDMNNPIVIN